MAEGYKYGFYQGKDENGNVVQATQTSDYKIWVNQSPYTGKLTFGDTVYTYENGVEVSKVKKGETSTKNKNTKKPITKKTTPKDTPIEQVEITGPVPAVDTTALSDEQAKRAGMTASSVAAQGLPKVNPATGATSDLFTGKYGVFEALIDDPIYGPELREIKAALAAGNQTLADDLWNRSKWGRLDSDTQIRTLMKIQNQGLYKERLKSWLINIRKQLAIKGIKADDATLTKYYDDGIDDETIIDELTGGISAKGAAGETADALDKLRTTARLNGFSLEKDFGNQLDGWLQRISRGESVDDFSRIIRSQAKLGLPEKVGTLLDEGLDLANIYAPYRTRMANLLELTPDAISLDDPLLRSAYGQDKEMSLYDFQRAVRKDPRWQYTDNAREEVSSVALGILRDFGFQG